MPSPRPRILCAITSDDLATSVVATARRLAQQGGYDVHYLHAADVPTRTVPVYGGAPGFPGYSRDLMVREAGQAGQALLERLGLDRGSAEVVIGDPVREIRHKADEIDPELVLVGSRGHGPISGAILGSVTRALASEGRWPLLIVRNTHDAQLHGPVVCGVAGRLEDAEPVVQVAERFARRLGRELILAHVEEDEASAARIDAGGFPAAPGGVLPAAPPRPTKASSSATVLDELTSRLADGGVYRSEVLHGSPASELSTLASEEGAQALVVGRRGLGALRSAIEGSVSLELTRSAGCPVMIVPGSSGVGA